MLKAILSLAVIALILSSGPVLGQPGGPKKVNESLTGYEEFPPLSTPGGGKFNARINKEGTAIAWELSYKNLESPVIMAHIHFENPTNNGPIVVWLCDNTGNGPAGTQACPAQPATIDGTILAANVGAGAVAQGIAAGELAEFIRAIRAGSTYVNVHSEVRTTGEIRSQLHDHPGHGPHPH